MKPKQNPKVVKETIDAPYKFTDAERLDIASQLAAVTTHVNELEDRKKSVTSDFKAQIDSAVAKANSLSSKFTAGFEMRPTECRVEFEPKASTKHYYNLQTNEFVKSVGMNANDFHQSLPMDGVEAAPLPNPVIPEDPPRIVAGEKS